MTKARTRHNRMKGLGIQLPPKPVVLPVIKEPVVSTPVAKKERVKIEEVDQLISAIDEELQALDVAANEERNWMSKVRETLYPKDPADRLFSPWQYGAFFTGVMFVVVGAIRLHQAGWY